MCIDYRYQIKYSIRLIFSKPDVVKNWENAFYEKIKESKKEYTFIVNWCKRYLYNRKKQKDQYTTHFLQQKFLEYLEKGTTIKFESKIFDFMSFLSLDCEFDMRKPETFSDQMFLMEEVSQFMQEYQEN